MDEVIFLIYLNFQTISFSNLNEAGLIEHWKDFEMDKVGIE